VTSGGYFGTKKALEPVHVQYGYDDNSVVVVNETYQPLRGLKVSAKIYNVDATEKGAREASLDEARDSSTTVFALPPVEGLSATYFLKLQLHDAKGKLVSENFYWLSTKADTLDWAKRKDTVYTPQKEFGDLTGLQTLPQVKLDTHAVIEQRPGSMAGTARVQVKNPSKSVAFMVHLRLTQGQGGDDVAPVLWGDNYFSLLPGETKEVKATYEQSAAGGKLAELEIDGFNVAAELVRAIMPRGMPAN